MKTLKINQERFNKLIKDYEKNISEAETWIAKMKMLVWDLKMLVEKDKEEEQQKQEFNG
jgi:hypothetical protein